MTRIPNYSIATKMQTTAEKIGQLFMPAAFINDSEKEIQKLEILIQEYNIGSLCFFHSRASAATNYEGKKEIVYNEHSFDTLKNLIKRYQSVAKYPLLIAIDAEWGLAMRIENTPQYPYAITLGAIQGSNDLIFEVGKNIALDCKAVGIHWNLAPCIDININPNNPVIGYRSFGEDKQKVTEKALAFIQGTQSEGILTSIKHFPGHGDTATDSHLELPMINKSMEELIDNELYPFQKLIETGVDSIMVGHLSVPGLSNGSKISSSISKDLIKGVLRKEMGFEGVVISDALNMHAVAKHYSTNGELEWLAFDAGNDILCFAEHIEKGVDTILKNASKSQIEESFKRVWKLKIQAQVSSSSSSSSSSSKLTESSKLNRKLAYESLTLLQGSAKTIEDFRKVNYFTLIIERYPDISKDEILNGLLKIQKEVANEENILLLLTPPQIKPTNNYGYLNEEIELINYIFETKNVVLYLFGSPFVLHHINIKKATAAILVYQDFKEFKDIATEHFLGKIKANGKLPIKITL